MASKDKNTFRFAVGAPDNPRSHVWRLWVQGDDVYVGARSTLHVFKVSLHASGDWRFAFVKELDLPDGVDDRVVMKWRRPDELPPGLIPSFGILVSSIEPQRPFAKQKVTDNKVNWFPLPGEGNRLVFTVLITRPELTNDELNAIFPAGHQIVVVLQKANGENVSLLVGEAPLTSIEREKIKNVMSKTKIHMKPGSMEDSLDDARGFLVVAVDEPTASTPPSILDIPLGKENLDIPPLSEA